MLFKNLFTYIDNKQRPFFTSQSSIDVLADSFPTDPLLINRPLRIRWGWRYFYPKYNKLLPPRPFTFSSKLRYVYLPPLFTLKLKNWLLAYKRLKRRTLWKRHFVALKDLNKRINFIPIKPYPVGWSHPIANLLKSVDASQYYFSTLKKKYEYYIILQKKSFWFIESILAPLIKYYFILKSLNFWNDLTISVKRRRLLFIFKSFIILNIYIILVSSVVILTCLIISGILYILYNAAFTYSLLLGKLFTFPLLLALFCIFWLLFLVTIWFTRVEKYLRKPFNLFPPEPPMPTPKHMLFEVYATMEEEWREELDPILASIVMDICGWYWIVPPPSFVEKGIDKGVKRYRAFFTSLLNKIRFNVPFSNKKINHKFDRLVNLLLKYFKIDIKKEDSYLNVAITKFIIFYFSALKPGSKKLKKRILFIREEFEFLIFWYKHHVKEAYQIHYVILFLFEIIFYLFTRPPVEDVFIQYRIRAKRAFFRPASNTVIYFPFRRSRLYLVEKIGNEHHIFPLQMGKFGYDFFWYRNKFNGGEIICVSDSYTFRPLNYLFNIGKYHLLIFNIFRYDHKYDNRKIRGSFFYTLLHFYFNTYNIRSIKLLLNYYESIIYYYLRFLIVFYRIFYLKIRIKPPMRDRRYFRFRGDYYYSLKERNPSRVCYKQDYKREQSNARYL